MVFFICEVKRADTYPWQTKNSLPNKQAVNKAENQLTKDVDILMALLAGTPPDQIVFHTLACYPDSSIAELQTIFCDVCLEQGVICQEDLNDLSLLQKKTKVPDKPDPATTNGQQHLLRFTARCLSHQSLLHVGYRKIEDHEHLVTETFNVIDIQSPKHGKQFQINWKIMDKDSHRHTTISKDR